MTFWSLRAELVLNLRQKNRKITQVISKLFIKSKIEELESRTFAAHIHVQTYRRYGRGQTIAQNIEKWATADYVELDGLSSQLSQKVSEALKDGIIDADEEGAISALQEK